MAPGMVRAARKPFFQEKNILLCFVYIGKKLNYRNIEYCDRCRAMINSSLFIQVIANYISGKASNMNEFWDNK